MRQSGVVAGNHITFNTNECTNSNTTVGTNANKKVKPKTVVVNTGYIDELRIKLRDNIDFSGPKRRTANFEHPFDKVITIMIVLVSVITITITITITRIL